MQSCKKCGRKDVRNDRPTDNRLSVSTPEVKLCIQYPLSFPFLYYFEFGFSKRERTDRRDGDVTFFPPQPPINLKSLRKNKENDKDRNNTTATHNKRRFFCMHQYLDLIVSSKVSVGYANIFIALRKIKAFNFN